MEYKKVIIVDANDEIVAHKNYKEIDWTKDRIRGSRLWVEDEAGNVLMQKRGNVDFNPNKFVFAVGGMNDEGDTYEATVRREAQEEIGVTLSEVIELGKVPLDEPIRKGFLTYFKAVIPGDRPVINFDPNEVAGVQWFSKDELRTLLEDQREMFVEDILDVPFKFGLL